MIAALASRVSAGGRDRGEGPISVLLGVTVFMLLAFALGPAITAYTHLNGTNAQLRRVGKELSAMVDQQRRAPWDELDPNAAPVTETAMLDDVPVPVTTWVTALSSRVRQVHMAAPQPMSGQTCSNPAALGAKCIVRTAIVAASADTILPTSSAGVTFTSPTSPTSTGATTTSGGTLASLARVTTQTRVYVLGYNAGATTPGATFARLGVFTSGIARTHLDLDGDGTGWVFGSAVVCPGWVGQVSGSALTATTAGALTLSDVVVRTAPDSTPNRC